MPVCSTIAIIDEDEIASSVMKPTKPAKIMFFGNRCR